MSLGPQIVADHVTCYYTTDGGEPEGQHGVARSGAAVELARASVAWNTLLWGYSETWSGRLPAQPSGTLVRFSVGLEAVADLIQDLEQAWQSASRS